MTEMMWFSKNSLNNLFGHLNSDKNSAKAVGDIPVKFLYIKRMSGWHNVYENVEYYVLRTYILKVKMVYTYLIYWLKVVGCLWRMSTSSCGNSILVGSTGQPAWNENYCNTLGLSQMLLLRKKCNPILQTFLTLVGTRGFEIRPLRFG